MTARPRLPLSDTAADPFLRLDGTAQAGWRGTQLSTRPNRLVGSRRHPAGGVFQPISCGGIVTTSVNLVDAWRTRRVVSARPGTGAYFDRPHHRTPRPNPRNGIQERGSPASCRNRPPSRACVSQVSKMRVSSDAVSTPSASPTAGFVTRPPAVLTPAASAASAPIAALGPRVASATA